MGALAALLVVAGIVCLIWAAMQKFKAGRLAKAPFAKTGEVASNGDKVAGEKGAISVEGDVKCAAPLISPVTGTPCLYYELKVMGSWKEGDETKEKEYHSEKKAAAFGIDDGSGIVQVDASSGGDYEPFEKTFDETKKEGFFADLKSAVGKGEPIMFGKFAFENPTMSVADKFTCTEKLVKVQPRMFALGKHEGGQIKSPSWTSLILSNKTRDALLGSTAKAAKNFGIGGGAALAVGLILGIVSSVMAPKEAAADTAKPEIAANADDTADTAGDVKAAVGDGDETGDVKQAAAGEADGICAKAQKCCEILSGPNESACAAFAQAPETSCETSVKAYAKALKASKNKRASECQ
jgi:hypothetical protein